MRLPVRFFLFALALVPWSLRAATPDGSPSLDSAYRAMYALNFQEAELEFFRWQQEHAADPLGPASRAANLLFSEFDRQGVLQAQFFVDDASFKSRAAVSPDPQLKRRFEMALGQAEALARQRVAKDAGDREALFALALVYGLRADYAALIEKRNWSSLGYTRDASEYATKLLAIAPDYYDAYLATGISQYIVGSLVAPVRWVARLAGYKGDKAQGIQELKLTAERGRYLAPFARILLAIVYLRQRDTAQARELLVKLRDDFPSNPLFAQEVHRIDLLRR